MKLPQYALLGLGLMITGNPLHAKAQAPNQSLGVEGTSVKTFYFSNLMNQDAENEVLLSLRSILPPEAKANLVYGTHAIVVRGTPEALRLAEETMHGLDKAQATYRLTYTITEMDGGKRIGLQHCSIVVAAGGRTTLKQGSKIPINTGTFDQGKNGTQTQVTYLDVGLNIDSSIDQMGDGVRLRQKIESSGIAEEKSGLGAEDPIVRQTVLEGTGTLLPGKPLVLGSLDVPGSTRHLDIEVTMEPLK